MLVVLLTAIGTFASIVGLYAAYRALTGERHKVLAYEASYPFPVASASSLAGDYELSVHFRPQGGSDEKIEVRFFSTFGLPTSARSRFTAKITPRPIRFASRSVVSVCLTSPFKKPADQ